MSKRTCVLFLGAVLLVLGTAGTLGALNAAYNRPNPTMDYVPQDMGIYDTMYSEYDECGCRVCHGNSTADRHHYTNIVLRDKLCTVCHPTCTPGTPDCENGILVIRDCTTSGCHSWGDVGPKDELGSFDPANTFNGWHHNTDMAAAENCTGCHNPNLIEEIDDFRDHQLYPPTVTTPSPFSCENCHWEQDLVAGTDCDTPGHPSTYDFVDMWGTSVGYYEYGKPIYGNFDTHHMGFKGDVASDCAKCHSQDPNNPSWNPYNPELMRYCQICHSMLTLHTIAPHVSPHPGWFPVGFHANDNDFDGSIDEDPTDTLDNDGDGYVDEDPVGNGGTDPFLYATWDAAGSLPGVCDPEQEPGYTADMQCWGCHADNVPPWTEGVTENPWIDPGVDGLIPVSGSCSIHVTIRGGYFGSSQTVERWVELKVAPGTWIQLPVHAWTDNVIEIEIPCWTLAPGNYPIRVHTEAGNSNNRNFTIKDHPTLTGISPASGGCSTTITLSGSGGFGTTRKTAPSIADPTSSYYGIYHTVDFVSSQGMYTVNNDAFVSWGDTSITLVLNKVFEDQVDPCGDPTDKRNFVRDDGVANPCCPNEPKVANCQCLGLGLYQVYVKAIYYGDEDGSDTLTCGDIIFQVEKSDPVQFELVMAPFINKVKPNPSERWFAEAPCGIVHKNKVKIIGANFGPTQEAGDEVRFGSMSQYSDYCAGINPNAGKLQPVCLWSATKIKVKLKADVNWEGKTKYMWVSKGGQCSNAMPVGVLEPVVLCP